MVWRRTRQISPVFLWPAINLRGIVTH